MWVTLIVGNGLLMCMYSMEWFANQNCPRKGVSTALLSRSRIIHFCCQKRGLLCHHGNGNRAKISRRYHVFAQNLTWYFIVIYNLVMGHV